MSESWDAFGAPLRVLVTRAAEDAPTLAHALALAGFEPVVVPLLERRWLPLAVADAAIEHPQAQWVVVTSATAADVIAIGAPSAWKSAGWAAVGPATAERLVELGYSPRRVPERATAHDLIVALGDLSGQTVIYPSADLALPATADGLRASGAAVVEVVAYENAAPVGYERRLHAVLPVAVTTVMSGSAAERIVAAIPVEHRELLGKIVAIGPSTARIAMEHGLEVHAIASPHTVNGVVAAVAQLLTN